MCSIRGMILVFSWSLLTVGLLSATPVRQSEHPDASSSSTGDTVEDEILREWFSALLGLSNPSEILDATRRHQHHHQDRSARARTPQYVQSLYDRMVTMETEQPSSTTAGRRSRSVGGVRKNALGGGESRIDGDQRESATIQAFTKNGQFVFEPTNGSGYVLRFNIDQTLIPLEQLQSIELVLTVDYSRLVGPPGAYTIFAYSIDDDQQQGGARLLVNTGSLGALETFHENFVTLNVSEMALRKLTAAGGGPRSSVQFTFEMFVAYNDGGGVNRDLSYADVGNLLQLSNRGTHQPLLVLYSRLAKEMGVSHRSASAPPPPPPSPPQPKRQRRGAAAGATPPNGHWSQPDAECALHDWWVNLTRLFDGPGIFPDGFYVYFCGGSCQHPMYDRRWNATLNAHLRSIYNVKLRYDSIDGGSSSSSGSSTASVLTNEVPEPKCVARSYLPVTVVYGLGTSFMIRRLDDMVVTSCMCS